MSLTLYPGIASFDPSIIPGLELWLKAGRIAGLSDGAPVSTWPDLSGASNDATGGLTTRPLLKNNIINGRPVVRFDGINDILEFTDTFGPATSTFVVARLNAAPASQTAYAPFVISGTLATGMRICVKMGGTTWGSYGQTPGDISSGETLAVATNYLLALTADASTWFLYRDGVQKATGAGRTSGLNGDPPAIGAEKSASRYLSVDIAEVLMFDNIISTPNRQLVEDYLGREYAIAITH